MGNSGMIAGAFSSVSGKADKTLDSNGQILYYNSGRQALNIGSEGKVLTVSSSDLPAWETASSVLWSALADYEATSAESSHTFSFTAVDFDDDSYLVLELDGGVTLGTVALDLTIENNQTASYHGSGRRLKQGAELFLT